MLPVLNCKCWKSKRTQFLNSGTELWLETKFSYHPLILLPIILHHFQDCKFLNRNRLVNLALNSKTEIKQNKSNESITYRKKTEKNQYYESIA